MEVIINGKRFTAALHGGAAAGELSALLPLTLEMKELNGNEKYGDLPSSLTQERFMPGTIRAGDILLWGADTLVVFYETFSSSYSYTKIGSITDPTGIKEAVGNGSATGIKEAVGNGSATVTFR